LPAVITADKGLNEPRYPALKGIMAAKKKPLEVKPAALVPAGLDVIELAYPPERQAGRIVGEGADAVPALIDALRTEAKVL
jgi:electron transfer flavoprotein beta subunit